MIGLNISGSSLLDLDSKMLGPIIPCAAEIFQGRWLERSQSRHGLCNLFLGGKVERHAELQRQC